MPFDDNSWSQSKLVPSRELLASIERWKPGLQRVQVCAAQLTGGPRLQAGPQAWASEPRGRFCLSTPAAAL
eukprot:scaffold77691_cov30-Tisochrysis_lutea.AAC.3